jgi:TetR/AcrR family transcriptional repressor of nem operon
MARPREFEEAEALDRALEIFWRLGYDACSITDLTSATGLKRQSLYNAFGDKRGLFLAVLARYRAHSRAALRVLTHEDAGVADVRLYLESVLEAQRAGNFGACLMVKTAFGPSASDPEIARAVTRASREVRAALLRIGRRALAQGELPRGTEPEAQAAYWFSMLHGLSALACTGGATRVRAVLDQVFTSV